MRIIHTSDIHLDSPLTARLSPDKIRERKRELIASFRRTIDKARDLGATAYLIAGDLFDSDRCNRSTLQNLMATVASVPEITFFYLYGNHEKRMLSESGVTLPDNLKLFEEGWTYYTLGDVVIAGRCETAPGMFDELRLDPEKRNVVVLHGELTDRSDRGGMIGRREVAECPIDYLALGHYHSYSETKINERCTAVYSGTPEGRGFDEAGECGIVLLDVDRYDVRHEFIRCAKRTLHLVNADISGSKNSLDVENAVINATRGIPYTDIVRVLLVGERELELGYDTDAIKERLGARYYFFEVRDNARVRINIDDYKNDLSLKGEFIRSVMADGSLTDEKRVSVITAGLRALMGEEIE